MSNDSNNSIREVFLHMYNNISPDAVMETHRGESLISGNFADDEFGFAGTDADIEVPGEMFDGQPEGRDIETADDNDLLLPESQVRGSKDNSVSPDESEELSLDDLDASLMDAAADRIIDILENNRPDFSAEDGTFECDGSSSGAAGGASQCTGVTRGDSLSGESDIMSDLPDVSDLGIDSGMLLNIEDPDEVISRLQSMRAGKSYDDDQEFRLNLVIQRIEELKAWRNNSVSWGKDIDGNSSAYVEDCSCNAGGQMCSRSGTCMPQCPDCDHTVIGTSTERAAETLTFKRIRDEKEYASQTLIGSPLDCAFVAQQSPDALVSAVRIPFRHNLDLDMRELLDHGGMFFVTGSEPGFFSFTSNLSAQFDKYCNQNYTYNCVFNAVVLRTDVIDPVVSNYVCRMLTYMYLFYQGRELHQYSYPSSFALTGNEFREASRLIEQARVVLKTIRPDIFKGRQPWNKEFCASGRSVISSSLNLPYGDSAVKCWREDFFNQTGPAVRIYKGAQIWVGKGRRLPDEVIDLWQRLLYEGNMVRSLGRGRQYYTLLDDIYLGGGWLASYFLAGSRHDDVVPDVWTRCRRYQLHSRLDKARIDCTFAQTITRGVKEVMLFAGSKVASRDAPGTDTKVQALKDELIASGRMKDNGICAQLTDDVLFARSAEASAFIAGNKKDAAALWKLKTVHSL